MYALQIKNAGDEAFWLTLNMTADLTMYVLEPGMEAFYPFFFWPEEPVSIKLDKKTQMKMIFLRKETILQNGNCNPAKDYSYGGNGDYCNTYNPRFI